MGVRFVSGFDVVGLRLHEERYGQVSQYMHKVRGVGVIGYRDILYEERKRKTSIPSFVYSSMVFFSPTLKPSVLEAVRSSWWSAIVVVGVLSGGGCSTMLE